MKFTRREHRLLSLLAHAEAQVGGPADVPEQRISPTRRPVDTATRVRVDADGQRTRWTYRPEAHGWVVDGLPSYDWRGRPAGISLDTIDRVWPARHDVDAALRAYDPRLAEDRRRCRQFRAARR